MPTIEKICIWFLVIIIIIWVMLHYGFLGPLPITDGDSNPLRKLGGKLVDELLVAAIVAYIVILVIEKRSRKDQADFTAELVDQVRQEVFSAMLNMQFPPVIKDEIWGTMMKTAVYRPHLELLFEIEKDGSNPSRNLIVNVTSTFSLKNISNLENLVVIKQFIPTTDAHSEKSEITGIYVGGTKIDSNEYSKVSLATSGKSANPREQFYHRRDSDQDPYITGKQVRIYRRFSPGEQKDVEITYKLMSNYRDAYHWASHFCTESVIVTVSCQVKEIDFTVIPSNRGKLRTRRLIRNDDLHRTFEYDFDGPLLPFQGFVLMWWPNAEYNFSAPRNL